MQRQEYITDEQVVARANAAVRIAIEKKKAMQTPIVIYDSKTQKIYQKNPDGTKTVIGERIKRGRYSERYNQAEEA
ncbi:MAG: hypothetical protein ACI4EA_08310 [Candidatus Ornithomonoglobus sp.]